MPAITFITPSRRQTSAAFNLDRRCPTVPRAYAWLSSNVVASLGWSASLMGGLYLDVRRAAKRRGRVLGPDYPLLRGSPGQTSIANQRSYRSLSSFSNHTTL